MLWSRREEGVRDECGMKSGRRGSQKAPQVAKSPEQGTKEGRGPALKAPGRAHADHLTQHRPEVAGGDVHEQPFPDVRMPSKMHPPHPARLVHVRERPLQQLPATPQEPTTSSMPGPAGGTDSTCSGAAISVSTIDAVSPVSAPGTVTPTTAPLSRATACSAL